MNKNLIYVAMLLACALFFTQSAQAQGITVISNGNFGTVSVQPAITGTHNMEMGTNGTINYPAIASGPATGTVMTFQVTGFTVGESLSVRCEAGGTNKFANTTVGYGDDQLNVGTVRISRATGQAPGVGTLCAGTGTTSITYNFSATPAQNTFYISSLINVLHPKFVGNYSYSQDGSGLWNVRVRRSSGGTSYNAGIDMTGVFTSAATVTSTTNMDFARINYAGGAVGASTVSLGTNSTAVYAGQFSAGTGTLTAGDVTFGSIQNNVVVEVDCNTPLTLTDGAGRSIQVTGVKAVRENATGTYAGAGTVCNGIGGAATTTLTYTAGSNDAFKFGGILNGATAVSFAGGNYSTANAGGTNLTVILTTQ